MRFPRPARFAALGALGALLLSGCAAAGDPAPAGGPSSGSGFPIEIANSYGTATIDAKPERVATVAWGNYDVPLALGIAPVGMARATYGDDDADGILPWTFDALKALGATGDKLPALYDEVDGINFEQVADTAPDVVLGAYSGLSEEEYKTLSEIAPTVSFPKIAWQVDWRDMARIDGEALGLKDEAEEKVADVEKQMSDTMAQYPDVAGKTIAYVAITPSDTSSIYVYFDSRNELMYDLGLKPSASTEKLKADNAGAFYATLTAETADQLSDADIIVLFGDESTLGTLQKDPLLGSIPAIARGSVAVVPDGRPLAAALSGPTVLSIPWALPKIAPILEDAATKVP